MRLIKDEIFCIYGFRIKKSEGFKDLFLFEDLNPHVEIRRRLTRFERLQICWFFIKTIFRKN